MKKKRKKSLWTRLARAATIAFYATMLIPILAFIVAVIIGMIVTIAKGGTGAVLTCGLVLLFLVAVVVALINES